ncbi:PREDICTED: serine/threonine-protein kinase 19-like isoform X2 [Acropora digitifera]|uniref:serine/threonine-protein kinase 19-like isoform X2 n=1 Tax=Acropora digitifera TaxID=70779 RepID=UPI00077AE109|nr:PREDICTED: serine/threonine-protein kinase 19-like isoform X2 [Acropora digitifera]
MGDASTIVFRWKIAHRFSVFSELSFWSYKSSNSFTDFEVPNDTQAAILFLKSIVPLNKFQGKIPAIILKHQIYCVMKDKTLVDRQLNNLWEENKIRLFKLTSGSDEFAVVLTDDYVNHMKGRTSDAKVLLTIDKFINNVLPSHTDVSISKKDALVKFKLSEEEITHLVNTGVLTARDVGSWWLSIPGAGVFMKNFSNGRKALVQMIRKRKYREILERVRQLIIVPSFTSLTEVNEDKSES